MISSVSSLESDGEGLLNSLPQEISFSIAGPYDLSYISILFQFHFHFELYLGFCFKGFLILFVRRIFAD